MGSEEKVQFTFDASTFISGLQKAGKAFGGFAKSIVTFPVTATKKLGGFFGAFKDKTKKMGLDVKDISKGVFEGMKKFSIIAELAKRAFRLVSDAVKKNIPEIGTVFDIVKDIFFENLMHPIREMVLPMLQQILDWTREHRGMFVKWGTALANVFKVVIMGIRFAVDLMKTFFSSFAKFGKKVFGDSIKDVTDFVNILAFKFATVMIFLKSVLDPIVSFLGDTFGKVLVILDKFFKGFSEGFNSIQGFARAFKELQAAFQNFMTALPAVESVANVFEKLGKVLGIIAGGAVKQLIHFLTLILNLATNVIKMTGKIFDKDWKGAAESLGAMAGGLAEGTNRIAGDFAEQGVGIANVVTGKDIKKGNDFVVTKKGDIIKANPNDTITASQGSGVKGGIIINNTINVNATEGNARYIGETLGMSLTNKIRNILLDEMVVQGA